jgi:hypothetical protein
MVNDVRCRHVFAVSFCKHQFLSVAYLVDCGFSVCHQTRRQNHCVKVASKSFKNVSKFTHAGSTLTNQNCLHKKVQITLNYGNCSCYTFQIYFCLPFCPL